MTIKTKEINVSLGQLMLDPNNYRLNKGEETRTFTDDEVIDCQSKVQEELINENISDLETSILKNGFLEVDKIVVKEIHGSQKDSDLKLYLVIEGNRRTAAFKNLISENYIKNEERFYDGFPHTLIEKYNNINVILVEGTEEEVRDYSQRLMGIRHVSGPRQWGGYQSAKLIHDMSAQGYRKIATLLGMRPAEAQRRHEAYLAIQQMKQDPVYGNKANPKLFTLFAEIVASNKYFKEEWLEWNQDKLLFDNVKNLHRVYDAIIQDCYGKQEINNPSKLRFFVKCVNTPEIRIQIESGVKLNDIDYDFDEEARIKKIKSFISFVKKLNSISAEEYNLLLELQKEVECVTSSEDPEV